jgi:dTDP-3-amino-2,3,6-trideoxy-4-keto-D-glucose/dTDP-3-amino-3,4,6-trideoxy-alpha-D-glucose/dTDP-2,6-dideoxy-D-kanosamine transaminase
MLGRPSRPLVVRCPGVVLTLPIQTNDLRRHSEALRQDLHAAYHRVLESGWYILGEECRRFESEFANFCGVAECVGVANGTDAIELALRAIGVGEGTRVVTVANAGFYSTIALRNLRAEPVFVDVEPMTFLMNLSALRKVLAHERVSAVVVTHLFGLLHDMETVLDITAARGVPVLEDCAQAHGAKRTGRRAGSFGAVGTFSFYPTKNLGGIGDGGAVVTRNAEVAAALRQLRQYGWEKKYRAVLDGGRNSRLDELQAAILRSKLPLLDGWNRRRRQIATMYSEGISNQRVTCPEVHGDEFVAHLYVVTADNRDALRHHLSSAEIGTDVHYPIPDHKQPVLHDRDHWPLLPVTEALSQRVLTLPCFPELRNDEVQFIIDRINAWRA